MQNALALLKETVLETISEPSHSKVLFLNGLYDTELSTRFDMTFWQPFKPYAEHADRLLEDLNGDETLYPYVFLLCPKNVTESQYLIAQALTCLEEGGRLYLAAENAVNGKRLDKWIENTGLSFDAYKAHKSRCLVIQKTSSLNASLINEWLETGHIQENIEGFQTQAGLFCWNKIDRGSALLIETINEKLKGKGADFGCGYGYLTKSILPDHPKIKHMDLFDADNRALTCSTLNIPDPEKITPHWVDLAKPYKHPRPFDFIVMNPPFHEGKKQDHSIGQSFIINAKHNLVSRGGVLWMVANATLPYEAVLKEHFFSVELVARKDGFKILRALT